MARHPQDLADYVDGLLTADQELRIEQHLVACDGCRAQVDAERALIQRLRSVRLDAAHHQQLMSNLLSLADPAAPMTTSRGSSGVSVLSASAPPQYTSARRSVGLAMVAVAGCVGASLVALHGPTSVQPGGASVRLETPAVLVQQANLPGADAEATRTLTPAPLKATAVLNVDFPR
ncbi:anti-sigma factor family protein [Branchiibius cervicis]|uniref:Anti-sigma factor family protein n=1 Tax=Branchiibius cervicis TaxID=908252 RepID=A0ABW2AQX1_9MICO